MIMLRVLLAVGLTLASGVSAVDFAGVEIVNRDGSIVLNPASNGTVEVGGQDLLSLLASLQLKINALETAAAATASASAASCNCLSPKWTNTNIAIGSVTSSESAAPTHFNVSQAGIPSNATALRLRLHYDSGAAASAFGDIYLRSESDPTFSPVMRVRTYTANAFTSDSVVITQPNEDMYAYYFSHLGSRQVAVGFIIIGYQ